MPPQIAPIVVASHNAGPGFAPAMACLRAGGAALDAVAAAVRAVEDGPDASRVGRSALPNLLGHVELDALIMDGDTLAAGAVAALQGFPNPILVARRVMEQLPHLLLVGEGAAHFARAQGFDAARLGEPSALGQALPFERLRALAQQWAADAEQTMQGTVTVLARDAAGRIALATSSSAAWSHPGRVGAAPIIGAGGYADSRYGAAACSGRGEMALRAGSARAVVLYLKMGLPLWNGCREAIKDLYELQEAAASGLLLLALDAQGNHAGFANREGMSYLVQRTDMVEPEPRPHTFVDEAGRAESRPTLRG